MKLFDINNNYHMGHLFLDAMKSRPNAICQIDAATGESETNASVLRRSVQLARCLRLYGTRPGDVMFLAGWNHLDIHIPYYAAFLNGLTVTGVNVDAWSIQIRRWYGTVEEIRFYFRTSTPRLAFCQKEHLDKILQVVKELELNTKIICFDAGDHSLKKFIQEYDDGDDDEDFEPLIFNLDEVYVGMVPSTGTSKIHKMATFKHRAVINKIFDLKNNCKFYRKNYGDKMNSVSKSWLLLSQVGWVSTLLRSLFIPIMRYTKLMTSAPPNADHIIDIINKYRPSTVVTRIGTLKTIFSNEKYCDFSCFDSFIVSGDKIHDAYHLELRLIDLYTGNEIKEPNVVGEMWMKNVSFSNYYENPDITESVFTEDGWYKTGDLLYKDKDGNYFFVARLKNVIRYRSKLIFPLDLEVVIQNHPEVSDVAVLSVPHEEDGEHPVACVVKKPNSGVTAQQIKDLVDSQLSESYKLRGGVLFLKQLPYMLSGKLCYFELSEMVLSSCKE